MFLRERVMDNAEQIAFMVTLAHDEWLCEEEAGVAEGNFDTWIPFIMDLSVELAVPKPRADHER